MLNLRLLLALSLLISAFAQAGFYTAAHSTEAVMTFDASMDYSGPEWPSVADAKIAVGVQLDHLFGPMAAAKYQAVPKEDFQLTNVKVSEKPGVTGVWVIKYSYIGKILVENGPKDDYEITLPVNPTLIYQAGIVTAADGSVTYPCTDHHYQSEGDFWYFWNPLQKDCPLVEGKDYFRVDASIERIANTEETYPEYNRLAKKGTIAIDMIFGMYENSERDPAVSQDAGGQNYMRHRKELVGMGYTARTLSTSEVSALVHFTSMPFIEEFKKETPQGTILVRAFYGNTTDSADGFHWFYRDSLQNSAVMIYDGHSGLGGFLNINELEDEEGYKITFAVNQYQIYYFNSCSSYSYYNKAYFARKATAADPKGTHNLDIISNGLETSFDVSHDTNLALVKAIDLWATTGKATSYQKLASTIDSGNLTGINGDEDNPKPVTE